MIPLSLTKGKQMSNRYDNLDDNYQGRYDNLHGDEPEIDALARNAEAGRDVDAEIDRKIERMDAEDAKLQSSVKAYVHAQWVPWEKQYKYSVWSVKDMTASGYTMIQEVDVPFTSVPESVLKNGTINVYREQQKAIRAQAEVHCQNLQKQIDDLLCIEHKTEAK